MFYFERPSGSTTPLNDPPCEMNRKGLELSPGPLVQPYMKTLSPFPARVSHRALLRSVARTDSTETEQAWGRGVGVVRGPTALLSCLASCSSRRASWMYGRGACALGEMLSSCTHGVARQAVSDPRLRLSWNAEEQRIWLPPDEHPPWVRWVYTHPHIG